MNVIDAHHHVWDLAVRDQEWLAEPELAPIRRDFSLADLAPRARAARAVCPTRRPVSAAGRAPAT